VRAFQGVLDPNRRNRPSRGRAFGGFEAIRAYDLLLCCVILAGCSRGAAGSVPVAADANGGSSMDAAYRSQASFGQKVPAGAAWLKPDSAAFKELAVSNYGAGSGAGNIELFNKKYGLTETIVSGLNGTDGVWIDAKQNLYAANLPGTVTEYSPGEPSSGGPSFTYSIPGDVNGLTEGPVTVTTDKQDNVYVGYAQDDVAYVVEFPQGSSTPLAQCPSPNGGSVAGVTVDKKGDVFIAPDAGPSGPSYIYEYTPPLSNCNYGQRPVPVYYPGGLELDLKGNLVVEEQVKGDILIIPYPYSNVQTTLFGFGGDPYQLALSADNSLLFVAEGDTGVVNVAQYPSGTIEATLPCSSSAAPPCSPNGGSGISAASGVAVYPPPKPASR